MGFEPPSALGSLGSRPRSAVAEIGVRWILSQPTKQRHRIEYGTMAGKGQRQLPIRGKWLRTQVSSEPTVAGLGGLQIRWGPPHQGMALSPRPRVQLPGSCLLEPASVEHDTQGWHDTQGCGPLRLRPRTGVCRRVVRAASRVTGRVRRHCGGERVCVGLQICNNLLHLGHII